MPNIGILYIAGALREKDIDVQVADLCGIPEEYWQIPDAPVYGISMTTPQFHLATRVAEKIRKRQPNAVIVFGGFHPTAMPEECLARTECNIAVVGDGEEVMEQIVRNPLYRGDTKIILHPPMLSEAAVNKLPMPARDLIDIYGYQVMGTNAVVGSNARLEEYLITSRGCPFRCNYCAQMAMSKFLVRNRTFESIEQEMVYLMERYRIDRFYLFDDIFVIDKKRTYAWNARMRELLKKYTFDWHCLSRADIVCKAGKDLLLDMKASGCKQITYGIEHASNVILKRNHKDATAEQNSQAIKWTVEAGIRVRAQMIVGLPGETRETVEEVAEFIRNHPADSWGVHILVPLPGSPLWEHPEQFGFEFNRDETYEYYQTIGKPGEWSSHLLHKNSEEIREWAEYLRSVVGTRNVHNFDPKLRFGAVPVE